MPAGLSLKNQQIWLNKWGFKGENGKPLVEDGSPGKNTAYAMEQYKASKGKEEVLSILEKFRTLTRNKFTYTLIEENDLI